MTTPPPTSLSPLAKSRIRLLVMFEVSLALHLAIFFGLQIGAVERVGEARPVIEVQLAPSPAQESPSQQILLKAIDRPVKSQATDYEPPAEVAPRDVPKPAQSQAGLPEAAASPALIDVPLPADPTFYPSREVDVPAAWATKPITSYPPQAEKANIKGEVLVLLLVDELGKVQEASVVEVKPPGFGFEEAAMASVGQARFKPAMLKGQAVKSRVVYRVTFEP